MTATVDRGDQLTLSSQEDYITDEADNKVRLQEGMHIDIFDVDYAEDDSRDDLIASGTVALNDVNHSRRPWIKWIVKLDNNYIRHQSTIDNHQ